MCDASSTCLVGRTSNTINKLTTKRNNINSGGYRGVAMVSAKTPSENKVHAQNQFTEQAQMGETT